MEGSGIAARAAGRFTAEARRVFGENLTGVYLHGSAAMGCFNPAGSDLDLNAVVRESPDDARKCAFMDAVLAIDAGMPGRDATRGGIEMSIVTADACNPFVYPTPFELHYSRAHTGSYREDPEGYLRRMKGTDRDLAAHFTVIRHRGKCLYGPPAETVFGEVPRADYADSIRADVAGAREEIAGNTLYLTLNLARVLAFLRDGAVLSKQEGGEWGMRNLPEEFCPLVRSALAEYTGGAPMRSDPETAGRYAAYMLEQIETEA